MAVQMALRCASAQRLTMAATRDWAGLAICLNQSRQLIQRCPMLICTSSLARCSPLWASHTLVYSISASLTLCLSMSTLLWMPLHSFCEAATAATQQTFFLLNCVWCRLRSRRWEVQTLVSPLAAPMLHKLHAQRSNPHCPDCPPQLLMVRRPTIAFHQTVACPTETRVPSTCATSSTGKLQPPTTTGFE